VSADDERLRQLSRQAAKREIIHWTWPDDGEPYLTDRYGRQLAHVKSELALALDLAEQLTTIAVAVETLQPGRVFGPTLERRLRTSTETIVRLAEWNVRVIDALEQAWLDEQEKRR
jgi:hypothetical protein